MTSAKSTEKLRHSAFAVSVISLLPHIFCCLLPTAAALVSLGTTVGLGATLVANPLYRLVDTYHVYFLSLAVCAVAFSGLVNFIAWRVEAAGHNHSHDDNKPTSTVSSSFKIFAISAVLLVVDVGYFVFEKDILGLHRQ